MKGRTYYLLIVALVVPSTVAGQTADKSVIEAIEAIEEDWARAYLTKDASILDPILAEEFYILGWDGKQHPREDELRWTREQKDTYTFLKNKVIDVRQYGDVVIALGEIRSERTTPDGEIIEGAGSWQTAFTQRDGRWVAVASHAAPLGPSTDSEGVAMKDADRAMIEARLIQMESDWVTAYESGDLSALDRIFAQDFIYTVNDGTLYDKAAFTALNEGDQNPPDSVRIEDMDTRWYGSTAVVTGVAIWYRTDENAVVQRSAGRFTNVFVERDGRWQVVVGHSSPTQ